MFWYGFSAITISVVTARSVPSGPVLIDCCGLMKEIITFHSRYALVSHRIPGQSEHWTSDLFAVPLDSSGPLAYHCLTLENLNLLHNAALPHWVLHIAQSKAMADNSSVISLPAAFHIV
jgi:hypothetical protein